MVGICSLQNLREAAQRAFDDAIAGDFVEAGVCRGDCRILIRGVLAANNVLDRRCTSWTRLPASRSRMREFDWSAGG
jgi:O-methyltransferase